VRLRTLTFCALMLLLARPGAVSAQATAASATRSTSGTDTHVTGAAVPGPTVAPGPVPGVPNLPAETFFTSCSTSEIRKVRRVERTCCSAVSMGLKARDIANQVCATQPVNGPRLLSPFFKPAGGERVRFLPGTAVPPKHGVHGDSGHAALRAFGHIERRHTTRRLPRALCWRGNLLVPGNSVSQCAVSKLWLS
jgi:hypothetical protein